jgi:glycosyltransferase involved in cell wall biosynthesis
MSRLPIPTSAPFSPASVAVIITHYNQSDFLADAIASCLNQTTPACDILVVDDGSEDDPERVISRFPQARFVRRKNGGPSAARNTGLEHIDADMVVFLDADDQLCPNAITAGLACFQKRPEASMVYGAYRVIREDGAIATPVCYTPIGSAPRADLLRFGNIIAMHASVMYRRNRLLGIGAFDETLRVAEDYDVYLRIAADGAIAGHPDLVAEYRHHRFNTSRDYTRMYEGTCAVLQRQALYAGPPSQSDEIRQGLRVIRSRFGPLMFEQACRQVLTHGPQPALVARIMRAALMSPRALLLFLAERIPLAVKKRIFVARHNPAKGTRDN